MKIKIINAKNLFKYLLLTTFIAVGFLMTVNLVWAINTEPPVLQINIPTIQPSDFLSSNAGDWLGIYIKGVYNYAMIVLGILVAVIMMFAGVIWLTAGGNASQVDEAKKWLLSSLTGLILGMVSFMMLNIVNPDLTTFQSLKVKQIETKTYEGFTDEDFKKRMFATNQLYDNYEQPLPDDLRMVNPKEYDIIKYHITGSAQDTVNIEQNFADALVDLDNFITTYNSTLQRKRAMYSIADSIAEGIANIEGEYPISYKISSLNDGRHGQNNNGNSTHLHGRGADITGITPVQASIIGDYWLNQADGRRLIWEGDHLHIDIGYPPRIKK